MPGQRRAGRTGKRRCRMHGGAPGSGGPKGPRNGNYKHGRYTAEAIASGRWVAFGGTDPVATRLIDAVARPGGNITGISDNATALSTKRLELIKQAVPNLQRVAMLWNRNDLGMSRR